MTLKKRGVTRHFGATGQKRVDLKIRGPCAMHTLHYPKYSTAYEANEAELTKLVYLSPHIIIIKVISEIHPYVIGPLLCVQRLSIQIKHRN